MKRVLIVVAGALAILVGGGALLGACLFAAPKYRGPVTDHFDGAQFHDDKVGMQGPGAVLKWTTTREPAPWPEWIEAPPGPPPPRKVEGGALRVTFIGHATTLVQLDGVNVLTDPQYAERASPVSFAGPARIRAPGIRFEDLPKIDVVLVSHNHYDHLDLETLRALMERDHPLIVTGLGNDLLLTEEGIGPVKAQDWWQTVDVLGVKVTTVENQHFSARGLSDRDATLWTAFVVTGPSGSFYFAGDTGYGDHFKRVAAKFPSLRLAILPIGAYLPRWFMSSVHVDPAQAVQAMQDLGAQTALGMHFGTFPLADEGPDEPPQELARVLAMKPELRDRFWVLGFGEGRDVP